MNYRNPLGKIYKRYFSGKKVKDNAFMIFVCGVSRSGTTLLSAILDAHSQVCMGYEMNFPPMQGVEYIKKHLVPVQAEASNLKQAGSRLRRNGKKDLGKWISRCHRLGIDFEELLTALDDHKKSNGNSLISSRKRWLLINRVLDIIKKKTNATFGGFKITDTSFEKYLSVFPKSRFLYIVRDPRDVYSSLKERGFDTSLYTACKNWKNGIKGFLRFQAKHPESCYLLSYESLVSNPRETIAPLFEKLNLHLEDDVVDFHRSKAKILSSSHPNAANLKKGFFSSSVSRFQKDLSCAEIEEIDKACSTYMKKYDYLPNSNLINKQNCDFDLYSIPTKEMMQKKKWLIPQKKYKGNEYLPLLKPYLDQEYEVLTHIEYVRKKDIGNKNILLIRHDVDHDHMTAQRIANWEHEHGIRTTFCLLHTAWYYGRLEGDRIIHSRDLVNCAKYIFSLGHEINFHNNLVVTALKYNIDPVKLLIQELEFFDSIGIQIKGTSTHGDALCRQLEFRNWELFRECCDNRFGGPRTVAVDGNKINLGEYSMFDFGLEYEAYDMSKDVYHTDSGGRLRTRENTRGRRVFGRKGKEDSVVGVLTHPIWWEFY